MPSGVLFVFTAALGTDRLRVQSAALWLAAAIVAIAALRALHLGSDMSWLGRRRGRLRAAMPAAFGMAAIAVFGAVLIGPRLPGANAEPLLDTRQRQSEVTEVLSPLVDIRSRLVNRTNTEMFTVEASSRQYWRVAGLAKFDGTMWGLPDGDMQSADGVLNVASSGSPLLQQRIRISRLGGHFVPAAFAPITVAQNEASWLPDSDTIVVGGEGIEEGDVFNIASDVAAPSSDALRATTSNSPPDEIFLELPSDFPDEVTRLAEEITAGATTSYDQAMMLQNWFLTEFTYDLKVQRGHGEDAIIAFLRNKRGYCEQFSATFAAMARSIGLPARVAVGFTYGELHDDGRYHVLGRHAHAWPEVWFDGVGWVYFEPTPGRGAPGQEEHTGVSEAQDTGTGTVDGITEGDDPSTQTTEPGDTVAPTTVVGGEGAPPTTIVPGPGTATTRDDGDGGGQSPAMWIVLALLALVAWALLMPRVVRRLTRPGRTPSEQVIDAWHGTVGSLSIAGAPALEGQTPLEYAVDVERELGVDHRSLGELARYVTRAVYSPAGVGEPAAFRAAVLRTHLDEASQATLPWWSRLRCRLDPRLVRRRLIGDPAHRR